VEPTESTTPDPAAAPAVPPPPADSSDPDVYVRPPKREEAPAWTPPAGVVTFTATTTARAGHANVPADRKPFDGRRVFAYLIDALCIGMVPLVLDATSVVTEGAWLVFTAISLIYFFLCEATTGQTVGKRAMRLRVVALDGSPASAGAISARTVLRILEPGMIGLIVLVCSGRRRRRLGDFLGGTVVVDATPDPGRPPRSLMTIVYPVGWLAGAVFVFASMGHGGDVYLAELDAVCEQTGVIVTEDSGAAPALAALDLQEAEFAAMRSLRPSPERIALHQEVLSMEWALLQQARMARVRIERRPRTADAEMQRLAAMEAPVSARYAQLGLPHCA
jgi:uncharacterized RDD family membrane protein YckC